MTATSEPLSATDRADIVAVCTRFAWCLDERRWDELEALFTPTVEVDYTDLFGAAATASKPAELVATSRVLLGTLTSTQHLVASHVVSGRGDAAHCDSQVIATHLWSESRLGERTWTVGGRYRMDVVRDGSGWLIARLRFELSWAEGNQAILREARQAGT